jgi:hypothetical protein
VRAAPERIYVLTPQARVIELPAGSTPVDFAYQLHSTLGHRCRGARVDGQLVPLNTPLANGQTVEILTARPGAGSEGPSRDWLNPQLGYVHSSRARHKVRQWFHALDLERDVASGREKVERVLGSGTRLVAVELGTIDPAVLAEVRRALEDGLQLRIRYHSFGRDHVGERTVEPHSLRSRDGRWYLTAWCTSAEEERVFRLDRVLEAETLDAPAVTDPPPGDALFDFAASGRSIRMVLGASDRWVATQYPTESERTLEDGRVEVVLSVGSTAWLERLLLRMGPDTVAEDLDTGQPLDDVRRAAAQRIIDRHG